MELNLAVGRLRRRVLHLIQATEKPLLEVDMQVGEHFMDMLPLEKFSRCLSVSGQG